MVEQIISSHHNVSAAGELNYISHIEQEFIARFSNAKKHYPQDIQEIKQETFQSFAKAYLKNASRHHPGNTNFFTDKMPTNFQNVGLIKLMFPNAKFLHIKRNPLDTILSCYFIRFANLESMSFSFDLNDAAFYYKEYERLMAHWIKLFPDDILTIEYENLLEHTEDTTRDMLSFLNLPWDNKCLEFYNNKRGVATPSQYQVRQPIYTSSHGRWKKYEKHIQTLISQFEPQIKTDAA